MNNFETLKNKMDMETLINTVMIENVNDIDNFIASGDEVILNSRTLLNNIADKYTKRIVLPFNFKNKEQAVKWMKANREDFIKSEELNKDKNIKLIIILNF